MALILFGFSLWDKGMKRFGKYLFCSRPWHDVTVGAHVLRVVLMIITIFPHVLSLWFYSLAYWSDIICDR